MKAIYIMISSFALTGAVIFNAFYQKKQFYPSVVYLTKSNPSMAVLYAQAFVFVVLLGKLFKKIFFGQLRQAELEHLIEKSWYAITETCLAFTVFRDDFSPKFVAMFTLLLFLKAFHWLAEERIDFMERSPVVSYLFHIRAITFTTLLLLLDLALIHYAYENTLAKGATVQLVFGFEYAILLTIIGAIIVKYVLHTIDLQSENPWESKAVYLLYAELVLGFIKVILYVLFFTIMMKVHTFPLFAIRPMYLTVRSFKKALNDVIKSRRAIRNMNTLYPNASEDDLRSSDNVCIICREEMLVGSCKKLPCNHIFHTVCLRSWFQRQQSCPTCRMDVLRPPPQPSAPTPNPNAQQPAGVPQPTPVQNQNVWQRPSNSNPLSTSNSATSSSPNVNMESLPPQFVYNMANQGSSFNNMYSHFSTMPPPPVAPILPQQLAQMTNEQLKKLEGCERQAVEARILCLRNIRTLLDAAFTHFHQYNSIASFNDLGSNSNIDQSNTKSESKETHGLAKSKETLSNQSTEISKNQKSETDELEGAVGYSRPNEIKKTPVSTECFEDTNPNEIRRRRLEKLEKTQENGKPFPRDDDELD